MLFYAKFEYCFYTKNETVLFSSPSLSYLPVRLALCLCGLHSAYAACTKKAVP